jgi:hypothetical protein
MEVRKHHLRLQGKQRRLSGHPGSQACQKGQEYQESPKVAREISNGKHKVQDVSLGQEATVILDVRYVLLEVKHAA